MMIRLVLASDFPYNLKPFASSTDYKSSTNFNKDNYVPSGMNWSRTSSVEELGEILTGNSKTWIWNVTLDLQSLQFTNYS